jgi:hypothetical protein
LLHRLGTVGANPTTSRAAICCFHFRNECCVIGRDTDTETQVLIFVKLRANVIKHLASIYNLFRNRDSSVSTFWLGYGLDDRGSIPDIGNDGIFFYSPPRPHWPWGSPSLLTNGYWGFLPRGREADHSPPSHGKVKNAWSCTSTSQYVFMTWHLVTHRDSFVCCLLTILKHLESTEQPT